MRLISALALVTLLCPTPVRAAWRPGGDLIGHVGEVVATSSGGYAVVAWTRQVSLHVQEVRAQAWTRDGELAPGWPAAGVLVSVAPGAKGSLEVCEDGEGGIFVAWANSHYPTYNNYLQRVSATGVAPGWPADGLRLVPGTEGATIQRVSLAPDGAGGVVVGWNEIYYDPGYVGGARIHRVDGGGAALAEWPPGGFAIPDAREVGIAASGSRVFVSTANVHDVPEEGGIRLWRLGPDATPDPGWPVTIPDTRYAADMRLIPEGAGGVFAGWANREVCLQYGCPPRQFSTTRILADGTQDSGWSPAPMAYSIAPDGVGGLLMGLRTQGRPGVLRLDAAGAPLPGWESSGNRAMTEVVSLDAVHVADDGAGGSFVAWSDSRSGQDRLYASRLDSRGRLADGWPATGSFVNGDGGRYVSVAGLVSLGGGVAIVVWSEWTPEGRKGYLAALQPGEPGPIADLGPVPAEVGFGVVHLRSNPTHGPIVALIELPNEGAARVDLLDAAGRVLESQDFAFTWQARGAVRFNQARQHPPGVYWVRVAQGPRRSIKKAVLIE